MGKLYNERVCLLPPPRILGPSNKETFSQAGPKGIKGKITPDVADWARRRYNCSEYDEDGLPAAMDVSVHCNMAAAIAPPLEKRDHTHIQKRV